jgi:outer membrane protein OmpA-like peptidoglycan-associated protein
MRQDLLGSSSSATLEASSSRLSAIKMFDPKLSLRWKCSKCKYTTRNAGQCPMCGQAAASETAAGSRPMSLGGRLGNSTNADSNAFFGGIDGGDSQAWVQPETETDHGAHHSVLEAAPEAPVKAIIHEGEHHHGQPARTVPRSQRVALTPLGGGGRGAKVNTAPSLDTLAVGTAPKFAGVDAGESQLWKAWKQIPPENFRRKPARAPTELERAFPKTDGWELLRVDEKATPLVLDNGQREIVRTFRVVNRKNGHIGALREGAAASAAAAAHAWRCTREVFYCVANWRVGECARSLYKWRKNFRREEHRLEALLATTKMRMIQERVDRLMSEEVCGVSCDMVTVDLRARTVRMSENIQFEGGKCQILEESKGLLDQVEIAKESITQCCKEYHLPNMHWNVEGHTAPSRKADGGLMLSKLRAIEVCRQLVERGSDDFFFHADGRGCFVPPPGGEDPRRVLIHVMTPHEVTELAMKKFTEEEVEEFRMRFNEHDKDGGGTICPEELALLLHSLGQDPTPERLRAIIGAVDQDNDGEVDFEEFVQMELLMQAGLIHQREQEILDQEEIALDWTRY